MFSQSFDIMSVIDSAATVTIPCCWSPLQEHHLETPAGSVWDFLNTRDVHVGAVSYSDFYKNIHVPVIVTIRPTLNKVFCIPFICIVSWGWIGRECVSSWLNQLLITQMSCVSHVGISNDASKHEARHVSCCSAKATVHASCCWAAVSFVAFFMFRSFF